MSVFVIDMLEKVDIQNCHAEVHMMFDILLGKHGKVLRHGTSVPKRSQSICRCHLLQRFVVLQDLGFGSHEFLVLSICHIRKSKRGKKDVKDKDEQCNVTADLSLQRQFPFQDSQRVQINRHKNRVMDFFADRYI